MADNFAKIGNAGALKDLALALGAETTDVENLAREVALLKVIYKLLAGNTTAVDNMQRKDDVIKAIAGVADNRVDTSDATATAADIANGKTAYVNGVKITGTADPTLDTSDATAVAADIAEGKTAYVNGVKITGTAVFSA